MYTTKFCIHARIIRETFASFKEAQLEGINFLQEFFTTGSYIRTSKSENKTFMYISNVPGFFIVLEAV